MLVTYGNGLGFSRSNALPRKSPQPFFCSPALWCPRETAVGCALWRARIGGGCSNSELGDNPRICSELKRKVSNGPERGRVPGGGPLWCWVAPSLSLTSERSGVVNAHVLVRYDLPAASPPANATAARRMTEACPCGLRGLGKARRRAPSLSGAQPRAEPLALSPPSHSWDPGRAVQPRFNPLPNVLPASPCSKHLDPKRFLMGRPLFALAPRVFFCALSV
jgi:hypothetical protein